MEVLAIIPARGGSKGIKRKNLITLKGKPLVAHSILHARASSMITRAIVSTEDDEIRQVALSCGAEVPFIRPRELAEDHVLDWPVFKHALDFLKREENYQPDLVVHLRPTAPYRKPEWINQAITMLKEKPEADSLRSVSVVRQHPFRMFTISKNGYLDPLMKKEHPHPYLLRRQDLPLRYYYNCVIDVTRPETILTKQSMTGDRMLPFIMDSEDVFDVDSLMDLKFIELFMENQK